MKASARPSADSDPARAAPTGEITGLLRADHARETTALQHFVDRLTALVGWPGFTPAAAVFGALWVAGNLASSRWLGAAIDPAPFEGLQALVGAAALAVSALVLTTQRREGQLSEHRQQLILELSLLNDQKMAKVIELIEEARRDNPLVRSRSDDIAASMSAPSDPRQVIDAIKG